MSKVRVNYKPMTVQQGALWEGVTEQKEFNSLAELNTFIQGNSFHIVVEGIYELPLV